MSHVMFHMAHVLYLFWTELVGGVSYQWGLSRLILFKNRLLKSNVLMQDKVHQNTFSYLKIQFKGSLGRKNNSDWDTAVFEPSISWWLNLRK